MTSLNTVFPSKGLKSIYTKTNTRARKVSGHTHWKFSHREKWYYNTILQSIIILYHNKGFRVLVSDVSFMYNLLGGCFDIWTIWTEGYTHKATQHWTRLHWTDFGNQLLRAEAARFREPPWACVRDKCASVRRLGWQALQVGGQGKYNALQSPIFFWLFCATLWFLNSDCF